MNSIEETQTQAMLEQLQIARDVSVAENLDREVRVDKKNNVIPVAEASKALERPWRLAPHLLSGVAVGLLDLAPRLLKIDWSYVKALASPLLYLAKELGQYLPEVAITTVVSGAVIGAGINIYNRLSTPRPKQATVTYGQRGR